MGGPTRELEMETLECGGDNGWRGGERHGGEIVTGTGTCVTEGWIVYLLPVWISVWCGLISAWSGWIDILY